MRLLFTLFVLLFTQLFLNVANASPHKRISAEQRNSHVDQAKPEERRKRKTIVRSSKKTKSAAVNEQHKSQTHGKKAGSPKLVKHTAHKHVPTKVAAVRHEKTGHKKEIKSITHSIANEAVTCPTVGKKAYGRHHTHKASSENCMPIAMSAAHKKRYQTAKLTAMNKLMHQVGKPYRWGGTSPNTGFDCSGLVYYAYKDLMRIKMPRTANEMYHLRDAAPIKRGELESGDLVFFKISKRGAADHVGVYLGNGKFIQSPRTGEDIKISYLADNYWQDHYVGARRVMTPKTIR